MANGLWPIKEEGVAEIVLFAMRHTLFPRYVHEIRATFHERRLPEIVALI